MLLFRLYHTPISSVPTRTDILSIIRTEGLTRRVNGCRVAEFEKVQVMRASKGEVQAPAAASVSVNRPPRSTLVWDGLGRGIPRH